MAFRPITALVEAAETRAFSLPAEVTSALAVERHAARFAAQAYETRVRSQEHGSGIHAVAGKVLDALAKGDEPGSDIEQRLEVAERDRRLADLRQEVAVAAQRRAVDRADTVVAGLAAEIVHQHLGAALAETIEAAKKIVPIVSKFGDDVDDSGHVVRHGDAKLIAAVRDLDGLVTRYNAIRRARQHLLAVLGAPAFDSDGSFAEFRNAPSALAQRGTSVTARPSANGRPDRGPACCGSQPTPIGSSRGCRCRPSRTPRSPRTSARQRRG